MVDGLGVGNPEGLPDGASVDELGYIDGLDDGNKLGRLLGALVGAADGAVLGAVVGTGEGWLGLTVG